MLREPPTRLFVAWVTGREDVARHLLVTETHPPAELREVLLMVHLFAGYPRQLAAMAQARAARVLPPEADEVQLAAGDRDAGWQVFHSVYGEASDRVAGAIRDLHPDVLHWVLHHAYGRVLGRPGLDLASREILAVSALTALGTLPQLKGHIRGALRCGASPQALTQAVRSLEGLATEAHCAQALEWIASESRP